MTDVLVIAPHPDDETFGCGGTMFSHQAAGDRLYWIIFTSITVESGYTKEQVVGRISEIEKINSLYGFSSVIEYGYPTCTLDMIPKLEMVNRLSLDINRLNPEIVYIPHAGDIHSDHKVVNEIAQASSKWFRHPSVKIVRAYETLSETGMLGGNEFVPNQYYDISLYIDRKVEAIDIYNSELGAFPFPRSEKSVRALANYRGANSGFTSAEAFQLLFQRI